MRGGTAYQAAALQSAVAGTRESTDQQTTVTISLPTQPSGFAYLYLIVQLENYSEIKFQYWIEGAGIVDGNTAVVMFTRPVTPDAVRTADSFAAASSQLNPLGNAGSLGISKWNRATVQVMWGATPIALNAFADNDVNARAIINQILTGKGGVGRKSDHLVRGGD